MRKKSALLILFIILFMLTVTFSSSSAQDIDLSNMDNAQLMALLQAIMEKLEDSGSGIQDPEQLSASSGQQTEEGGNQEAGERKFQIYENKKLILERMPDYMFYQPPTEAPDKEDKNPKPTKTPEHYNGEPDIIDGSSCTWGFVNGNWYCMKG